MTTSTEAPGTRDGSRDFDFWMGRWKVANRRLVKALAGCTEWETFDAIAHARPLPAGIGNYDDFVPIGGWRPGFVGMSLRFYHPISRKWSIYWVDNRGGGIDAATGHLAAPVVGDFRDGVGVFTGPDTYDGQPIVCRYIWSHITASGARWQQAFSRDGGETWETNWINEMTRLPG